MWLKAQLAELRPALVRTFVSAAVLAAGVYLAHGAGSLQSLQHRLEDARFRLFPRAATDSIVLVQIDPESIAELGSWPWPRRIHAQLLDKLRALGASDIAFDVDFSSPSTVWDDDAFADALRRADGSAILPAFKQVTHDEAGTVSARETQPLPMFADLGWIAGVNVAADRDGRIRRLPISEPIAGVDVPALASMLAGNGGTASEVWIDFGIDPATVDRISVVDVLKSSGGAERIKGRKVIVGASAIELRDFVLVPVHGFITGANFHAVAAETLLQGRALHPAGTRDLTVAFVVVALAGGLLLARKSWLWTLAAFAALSLGIEIGAAAGYGFHTVMIDTSALQALIAGLAIVAVLQEVDLGKINLWLARTEAGNVKAVLAQVVTDNFDGIVVADETGIIEAASEKAAGLLSLPPEALTAGKTIRHLPPELSAALADAIVRFRDHTWTDETPREFLFRRGPGDTRVLEYVVTPSVLKRKAATWRRRHDTRFIACLTFRDITEQRRLEQQTHRLAHFSTLTGLPNRNALQERLGQMLAKPERSGLALIVLDIDRFQSINATLGQEYGDMLIEAVASRLSSLTRNIRFAAHLGGDDFAVIVDGWTTRTDLEEIADLLLLAMGQPYAMDIRRLQLSFSAGAVACGPTVKDALAALIMADNALLVAKQWGGGVCKFHEEVLETNIAELQSLEIDLWTAFGKGQFFLVYQPQFDLVSGEIVGAEALLRWNHPTRGQISPAEFIPLAELTGLISPLGSWALEKACSDAAKWPGNLRLAVNLSVQQLRRGRMNDEVERALARSGLPPERLELEITESIFIRDSRQAMAALRELQRKGIHLALDDFGTGYSSLSYVSSFPFNKLKIDRSFVAQLMESETARAVVKTIIALTQHINIGVIAEGVETVEQLNALRSLGCREAQGFYFAKPLSADDLAVLVLSQNGDTVRRLRSA